VENIWSGRGEPSLRIWLTSDERHIPVKVESRIAVGSFVFELVSANF
jgi:Flp pilus assembly protein CpaB